MWEKPFFLAYVHFKQIYEAYFSLIIFNIADIEHSGAVFSLHRSPSMSLGMPNGHIELQFPATAV